MKHIKYFLVGVIVSVLIPSKDKIFSKDLLKITVYNPNVSPSVTTITPAKLHHLSKARLLPNDISREFLATL